MRNKAKLLSQFQALSFYLIITFVIIVEILLAVFFIPNRIQSIMTKRQEIAQQSDDYRGLQAAVNALSQVDKSVLDRYLQRSTAAIPNEKKTTGIVSGLSVIAVTNGVMVRNLELNPGLISSASAQSPAPAGTGLRFVPATLTVTANFQALNNFLTSLRKTSQIISVRDLTFDAVGDNNRVQIGVQIYYLAPRSQSVSWSNIATLTPVEIDLLEKLPETDVFTLGQETR